MKTIAFLLDTDFEQVEKAVQEVHEQRAARLALNDNQDAVVKLDDEQTDE